MVKFLKQQGYLFICMGLLAALVAAIFWALSIGTVKLPLASIYNAIMQQLTTGQPIEAAGYGPVHDIIWLLRLPRLVLAAFVGMGLSVCGVIMQAVVKNPWPIHIFWVYHRGRRWVLRQPSFWVLAWRWEKIS